MADKSNPSGSNNAKPPPRVIGNFTKLGESSRGGGPKLKFTPNMPSKTVVAEATDAPAAQATTTTSTASTAPASAATSAPSTPSNAPERGERGRGRGGKPPGRGRGAPSNQRDAPEMVPAGPFAMGPVAAGNAGVRSHHGAASSFSRSRGIPSGISGNGGNINLSNRADAVKNELKPVLPQNRDDAALMHTHEVYSDDDGDVIIDLEEVKMLDDMAPDALKREQVKEKVKKVKKKDKKGKGKDVVKKEPVNVEIIDVDADSDPIVKSNLPSSSPKRNEVQALDLSESEEEVELEDLHEYFMAKEGVDPSETIDPGQLYLFQFPSPFPTFKSPAEMETEDTTAGGDSSKSGKRVTFAEDTVPAAGSSTQQPQTQAQSDVNTPLEGLIGQLEVRQSGAVQMRLPNGMVFDVFAASQPSFLQQVVAFDLEKKKLNVLGTVKRRFVASPDIDALINESIGNGQSKEHPMELDQ